MSFLTKLFNKNPVFCSLVTITTALLIIYTAISDWSSGAPVLARSYLEINVSFPENTDQDELKVYINNSLRAFRFNTAESGPKKFTIPLAIRKISKIRIDPSVNIGREFKISDITFFSRTKKNLSGNALPTEVFKNFGVKKPENIQLSGLQQISEKNLKTLSGDSTIYIYPKKNLNAPQPLFAFLYNNYQILLAIIFCILLKLILCYRWRSLKLDNLQKTELLTLSKYEYILIFVFFTAFMTFLTISKPFILDSSLELKGIPKDQYVMRIFWSEDGSYNIYKSKVVHVADGAVRLSLPNRLIKSIKYEPALSNKITALYLVPEKNISSELPVGDDQIINVPAGVTSTLNYKLLLIQFICALFSTLCFAVLIVIIKNGKHLAAHLVYKDRYVFILFFVFTFPSFAFWILGQWPGALTHDSIYVWESAMNLRISDDHPLMNYLFYTFLRQFADSPGLVGICHGLGFSVAIAYGCYVLYRHKLPYVLILPAWLFLLFSVPAGIYTVTLWKDIPFTLSILVWGVFIYDHYLSGTKQRVLSRTYLFMLTLSALGLFFRPGGFIMLFAILFILWAVKVLKHISLFQLAGCFIILFILIELALPKLYYTSTGTGPFYKGLCLLNPVGAFYTYNYYTPDPIADQKVFAKFYPETEGLKKYLAENISPLMGNGVNNNVTNKEISDISKSVFRAALLNPGIFLADRLKIFFSTIVEMRPTYYGMTHYNLMDNSVLKIVYPSVNIYDYLDKPFFPDFQARQNEILENSHQLGGTFEGRHLHWNTMLQFIFALTAILFARWLPASALYSAIVLMFAGVVFLSIPTNNWRYLFFLYIGGVFIPPLMICEFIKSFRKSA